MNIFRILSSGRHPFREEFASALLAYLLSPKMDHGLGVSVLAALLLNVSKQIDHPELAAIAHQLDQPLRDNLFEQSSNSVAVELELLYPVQGSVGFIDVVVKYGKWFISIENKIYVTSYTKGQVAQQYVGLRQVLESRGFQDHRILQIYLVPALRNAEGWSISQDTLNEIDFPLQPGDSSILLTWQPTSEGELSFVDILRDLLYRDSRGDIPPMSYDIRQNLLAFIDFALGEFLGYPYERVAPSIITEKRTVSEILTAHEEVFVGVQYGLAGVVRRAWRNPEFLHERLSVSEASRGWQYLSLSEFKQLALWAINPDIQALTGIVWNGKPFSTPQLYLVAKAAGDSIFIGIQGGLDALKRLTAEQIRKRPGWEISDHKRGAQWFSGSDFCAVLENKGILYTTPTAELQP